MTDQVIIQADRLPRAIICHGSLSIEPFELSSDGPSQEQREGTAAHYVVKAVLNGEISEPGEYVGKMTPNGVYVDGTMASDLEPYVMGIMDRNVAWDCEVKTDFGLLGTNVAIHGRADNLSWDAANRTLHIDDLKFGYRIVEPYRNWTLIAHALGSIIRYGWEPEWIIFYIWQPRPFHSLGKVREWKISRLELEALRLELTTYFAVIRNNLVTSPHCYKCPALAHCPAARAAGMNSVDTIESDVFTDTMTDEDLSFELDNLERGADMIKSRLEALKELAMVRIRNGSIINGRAIEIGKGHRKWNDGVTADMVQAITGVDIRDKPTLVTPAEAARRGIDPETLKAFCSSPDTGPRLVRSEANERAVRMFGK